MSRSPSGRETRTHPYHTQHIMTNKEHIREIGVLILIGMILLIPSVYLFFIDGGQIRGINDDPATRPSLIGQNIDGLNFTPATGKIQPIYDDTEIVPVAFWQLSPREMLLRIITYPMAYIPPSAAKILSLLYLSSGLGLLVLYRRTTNRKNPDAASRREQIHTYISDHPGKTKQELADALTLPRSSLNYHLNRLLETQNILAIRYGKQLHYLPANTGLTNTQKNLLPLLAKEKDHLLFQTLLNHPALTRNEIAAELNLSRTTTIWYLQKLNRHHLLTTHKHDRTLRYSLTPETITAYQNITQPLTPPPGPNTA